MSIHLKRRNPSTMQMGSLHQETPNYAATHWEVYQKLRHNRGYSFLQSGLELLDHKLRLPLKGLAALLNCCSVHA